MRSQLLFDRSILYQLFHSLAVQLLFHLLFLLQAQALRKLFNLSFLLYLLFDFERQQSFSDLVAVVALRIDQSWLSYESKSTELGLVVDYVIETEAGLLDERVAPRD